MAVDFLAGLKVLDLGQGISAPFCAKMLADLGAQVIKVEPPGGDLARKMGPFPGDVPDSEKSGIFLALNTNKLGVTLNLETETGREMLLQLAQQADLLVENFTPSYLPGLGLDFQAFHEGNPNLVLTSVTPFGQTGPWANYRASNLVISNLSGHSREHPGPVDVLESQPPLQLAAHQAEFIAGLSAATASMLALNRRRVQGVGCHVDVSSMESLAVLPQTTLANFSLGQMVKGRSKQEYGRQSLLALLPCRDGYVGISPRQQDQWERMVELMDSPGWANDPKFATRDSRLENWTDLEPMLAAWTGSLGKEDVYRRCQSVHIPSFPMNTAAELFQSDQFKARQFFTKTDHPVAGKLSYPGWPFQLGSGKRVELSPAPLLGQDNHDVLGEPGLGLSDQQLLALRAGNVL
ncbi:MAG: CoA transferase [Chloroflexi bacterium]|nr:CoA transferase [Chloroflexota bacterium]MDA1219496.1 CoA transferase [Chloroflexota bacterium]